MAGEWHYRVKGKVHGPINSAQLRASVERGKITPNTPVQRSDNGAASDWAVAGLLPGLFPANVRPTEMACRWCGRWLVSGHCTTCEPDAAKPSSAASQSPGAQVDANALRFDLANAEPSEAPPVFVEPPPPPPAAAELPAEPVPSAGAPPAAAPPVHSARHSDRRNYAALKLSIALATVLGYLVAAASGVVLVALTVLAILGKTPVDVSFVGGVGVALAGMLNGVAVVAAAQLVQVVIDIESNTRRAIHRGE
ncbi:hypothetical protein Mal64_31760 [Pseudobythopirellula maris]|uniref:GYF domain-containing protein n=1 Tax=Pseudobythopirellula maris TaxID=2527991 RepID=A0A5C5ZJQ6_9BACT|nr:DUF4339 domain-containing protein [Pseudobythopirellula maris]TWT87634.1 hypothetical protein Mal64_31760 [Pseudobythopirellula maris]